MRGDLVHDCIYCKRRLQQREFHREHVLSKAFGTFAKAPVLHNCVCIECNKFFGDNLEERFARGSFEGMLRYQNGIRTPPEGPVNLRYVELTVPKGSDWSGVRLSLVRAGDGLQVELIPQVAFRSRLNHRWSHFTHAEICSGVLSDASELEKTSARIYARTEQERDSLLSALEQIGVAFKKLEDLPAPGSFLDDGKALVEITFTINDGIRRCVAKYAFNYSTFVCGADFMIGSDFDATRRFVRYGETPSYPVVVERFKPILHDDLPTGRQTDGHLITINWSRSGVDLKAQVSLFNYITYSISLARHYSGLLWRPIRSGVHFNIATKTVEPLTAISGSLMPRLGQSFRAFPIRK